jgi:hypothetical protein
VADPKHNISFRLPGTDLPAVAPLPKCVYGRNQALPWKINQRVDFMLNSRLMDTWITPTRPREHGPAHHRRLSCHGPDLLLMDEPYG